MKKHITLYFLSIFLIFGFQSTYANETERVAQSLLHILDYVSVDYPAVVSNGKILNQEEYKEQQEFAGQLNTLIDRLQPTAETQLLKKQANILSGQIQNRLAGEKVAKLAKEMSDQIVKTFNVKVAPKNPPVLHQAQVLFQDNCSACHGMNGFGDGPMAASLEPAPANFHDNNRQSQRSIYGIYNTINMGVAGTAMPGFNQLSDSDKWALAFYVSNFLASDAERDKGESLWQNGAFRGTFSNLSKLTSVTPADVEALYGEKGRAVLSYLRSAPEEVQQNGRSAAVEVALQKLQQSLNLYTQGNREAAHDAAIAAYLQGFELIENGLSLVDEELRQNVEVKMANYRNAIQNGRPVSEISNQAKEISAQIEQAAQLLEGQTLSPLMGAFSAFILLLREGLEAILVLAAIIAFLTKANKKDAVRYVHTGWISALLLGVITWVLASSFITISGANREITEGITALVAAVMLIYMGYWLHSNANTQRWKEYIHGKLTSAMKGSPVWALVTISFIAVYREVFETILFYETLWLQTAPTDHGYLFLGIISAAAVLVGTAWAIFRFSVRLPLRLFFTANAALLYAIAVVFAGKGVAALQEAGKLPINPITFPKVDLLGVYPNMETLATQAILISLALIWLGYNRFYIQQRT